MLLIILSTRKKHSGCHAGSGLPYRECVNTRVHGGTVAEVYLPLLMTPCPGLESSGVWGAHNPAGATAGYKENVFPQFLAPMAG